jgi:hypothetical protein
MCECGRTHTQVLERARRLTRRLDADYDAARSAAGPARATGVRLASARAATSSAMPPLFYMVQ